MYMSPFETLREHPLFEGAAKVAIEQAELSAVENGLDIPVGAVALFGASIIGQGYASDGVSGIKHMHAEMVALEQALGDRNAPPTTMVSTMEPCEDCQDALAKVKSIKQVVFVTPRSALSRLHLVKDRMSIEERVARQRHPYRVIQLGNQELAQRALEPLKNTTRDLETGITKVNSAGFRAHIDRRNT